MWVGLLSTTFMEEGYKLNNLPYISLWERRARRKLRKLMAVAYGGTSICDVTGRAALMGPLFGPPSPS